MPTPAPPSTDPTALRFKFMMFAIANSETHFVAPGSQDGDWNDYPNYPDLQLCTADSVNQAALSAPNSLFEFNISATCCEQDGRAAVRPDCEAHPVTYDEALLFCASYGHRLCTLQELMHENIANDAGCGFDTAYNWVSDECVS